MPEVVGSAIEDLVCLLHKTYGVKIIMLSASIHHRVQSVTFNHDRDVLDQYLWAALFTSYSTSSGGVAILFNNNFTFQLQRSFLDNTGRFIICDIETNEKVITLATIYAPNEDDPGFFERLHHHLRDFQCNDIIIGGDFNLVLDIDIDKKGGLAKTHTKAVKVIKDHMAELDLVDVWFLNRQKPKIHCRLDFFLVSQSLACNVTNSDVLAGFKTDHFLITIKLSLHLNWRGPGFWKLNMSLLEEDGYVKQIKTAIKAVQEEYQEDNTVDTALTWEMIKLKVREQSMMYAKTKQTCQG